jgi:hypothetical protein
LEAPLPGFLGKTMVKPLKSGHPKKKITAMETQNKSLEDGYPVGCGDLVLA